MTLSPDIRHTIVSHTANMPTAERRARARGLIDKYKIAREDWPEVARLAAVREEDIRV